jgi:hypothetical protein
MRPLKEYLDELKDVAREVAKNRKIRGSHFAWLMMIVGVGVTGTMTYALCHRGMQSSDLWASWIDVAALFPVVLMEGSALALTFGRHFWFSSMKQRALANWASWVVWVVLGLTSICHFALGKSSDAGIQALLGAYASYVLPLSIVLIPMLWKRLYDLAPESEARVEVLETEAELRREIMKIEREKNALMIESYRDSLNTSAVEDARAKLFERASIQHAAEIAGFIEGTIVEGELEEDFGGESEAGSDAGSVPRKNPELLVEAAEIEQVGSTGLVNGKAH